MSVGFKFTPVIMGLSAFSSLGTVLVGPGSSSHSRLGIDVLSLAHGEYWRLLSSGFCFPTYPQMFASLFLLYSFRHFERQMGSLKFGSFVVISYLLSTLTQLGLVVTASSMGFPLSLSSGPYFLVFSLLACYQKLVPKLHPSKAYISSIIFSEKSFVYFMALQLWLSEGSSSVFAGLSGFLSGYLYLNDVMSVQKVRVPSVIGQLLSPLGFVFGPSASSLLPNGPRPPPQAPPRGGGRAMAGNNNGEMLFGGQGGGNMRGGNFAAFQQQLAPPPPAPEEAIETLMNLGFERDRVVRALQSRQNNIEAAANLLLSGNE